MQGNQAVPVNSGEAGNFLRENKVKSSAVISLYLSAVMCLLQGQAAFSQADSTRSDEANSAVEVKDIHALYAGGGYGSNMIYLGSTISGNQPYGYAALSYGYKGSLFLTVSAVHLENFNPYAAFIAGTLSYSHTFNSWFDISLSASRYQTPPSLRETLFGNFWYSDLTLGADWRLLYTKLSAGWLYMDRSAMYYQVKNSRYITTPSFFKKKAYISFDPYVNILFGTLSSIELNTDTIVTVNYPFYQTTSGSGRGYGNGSGSGSSTGSTTTTGTPITTTQTVTTPVLSTRFGVMEIDFGIPVAFNTGRFTLEAEPGYILPLYDDSYYTVAKGFVFMLSAYIKIF